MNSAEGNFHTGIFHFRVEAQAGVREFLSAQGYDLQQVDHFLHHGCVYTNGVRIRSDRALEPDQIVRLHTRPKKYSWASGPLADRIVFDGPEFLVLDKPGGLPVHATLDNYVENAKYLLEQELGVPLYSTHRLDIPTSGLLILAKTPAAQTLINKLFAERRVEKIYRAVTASPVALGEHVLYLDPAGRVPRPHSFEKREGWWECRLRILESASVGRTSDTHPETSAAGSLHRHTIQLLTGKTHQIRAQLSALGCPIVGDEIYGSRGFGSISAQNGLQLECHSLSFNWRGQNLTFKRK